MPSAKDPTATLLVKSSSKRYILFVQLVQRFSRSWIMISTFPLRATPGIKSLKLQCLRRHVNQLHLLRQQLRDMHPQNLHRPQARHRAAQTNPQAMSSLADSTSIASSSAVSSTNNSGQTMPQAYQRGQGGQNNSSPRTVRSATDLASSIRHDVPLQKAPSTASNVSSESFSSGNDSTIRPSSHLRRQASSNSGPRLLNKLAASQTLSTSSSTTDGSESIGTQDIPPLRERESRSQRHARQPPPMAANHTTSNNDARNVLQQARRDLQQKVGVDKQVPQQKPTLFARLFGKRNAGAQNDQTAEANGQTKLQRGYSRGDERVNESRRQGQPDGRITTSRSEPSMRKRYAQRGNHRLPRHRVSIDQDLSYNHPDDHRSQFSTSHRRPRHRRRRSHPEESAEDYKARRLAEEKAKADKLDRDIAALRRNVGHAEERVFALDTRAAIERSRQLDPHEQLEEENLVRQAVIASLEHRTSALAEASGQILRRVKVIYDGCNHSVMQDGELYMDKCGRAPPKVVHWQGVCDACHVDIRSQSTSLSSTRITPAQAADRQPLAALSANAQHQAPLSETNSDNASSTHATSATRQRAAISAGKRRAVNSPRTSSLTSKSLSSLKQNLRQSPQHYEPSESPTMTSKERNQVHRAPPSFASSQPLEHNSVKAPSIAASEGVPPSLALRVRAAEEANRKRLFESHNRDGESHVRPHPEDASTAAASSRDDDDEESEEYEEEDEVSTVRDERRG